MSQNVCENENIVRKKRAISCVEISGKLKPPAENERRSLGNFLRKYYSN